MIGKWVTEGTHFNIVSPSIKELDQQVWGNTCTFKSKAACFAPVNRPPKEKFHMHEC